MKWLKRFICKLIGHRFDVEGVTGRYEWCSRCAERRERSLRPSEVDNAFREAMRERVDWRSEMSSMVRALRPDLAAEFESLYYGPPHKMAQFLDEHFSIAPDVWGVQNIAWVSAMFREKFVNEKRRANG